MSGYDPQRSRPHPADDDPAAIDALLDAAAQAVPSVGLPAGPGAADQGVGVVPVEPSPPAVVPGPVPADSDLRRLGVLGGVIAMAGLIAWWWRRRHRRVVD